MIQPQLCFIFFFSLLFISNSAMHQNTSHNHMESFHVGVILDMGSMIGQVSWSCLSMALSDFYTSTHSHYKTRLVLHLRDSQGDKVKAVPLLVFPKGSPLVADVSREILKLKDSNKMTEIDQKWFGSQATCSQHGNDDVSNSLNFYSFRALFIITGSISSFALLAFFANFLYKHRHVLNSRDSRNTIWLKFRRILKQFDKKDISSYRFNANVRTSTEVTKTEASPGRSLSPLGAEIEAPPGRSFGPLEGTFSTDLSLPNSLELEEMVDVSLSD